MAEIPEMLVTTTVPVPVVLGEPTTVITDSSIILELSGIRGTILSREFDPEAHELDSTFRLTKYSEMKASGYKISQETVMELIQGLGNESETSQEDHMGFSKPRFEIGMGASVSHVLKHGLNMVQTTDILYPLVDDPYMQGKIAAAAVLSGLYASGVTECDNMLMLMAISSKLTDKERNIVMPLMMRGFKDTAVEAGTSVTGGQSVINPWITMGGVASSICLASDIIVPESAVPGDVLVLTKPLGTLVAAIAHEWMSVPERWNRIKLVVREDEVKKAYFRAIDAMARLNRIAARLMHKFNAHAAIDVTGFGLLEHAQHLVRKQKADVSFVIHNLPVIAKIAAVAKASGNMQLLKGCSPETSGGLLICLPREQAAAYCKDIEKQEGFQAWIIGIVEKGNHTARIIDKPRIIEVPSKEREGELW